MIIKSKITYADGTEKVIEFEIDDVAEDMNTDIYDIATESDYINALNTLGVDTNEEN